MSPSDENTPLFTKGEYRKPLPTDLRSPCPIINSLANHGYIPRDGRQVRAAELRAAISEIGVSSTIGSTLTYGAYLEHEETPPTGVWAFLGGPFAYMLQHFGLRDVNEVDSEGVPCLNLDQLARHGVIEHDVSLSRRDTAQGDNCSPQKDLIAGLIMSSSDGVVITNEDLARFRRQRLYQQKRENPDLLFTNVQNTMACGTSTSPVVCESSRLMKSKSRGRFHSENFRRQL